MQLQQAELSFPFYLWLARKGSDAEKKWKIIAKHDGKPVAASKEALVKARLPKSRLSLSWHTREGFLKIIEKLDPVEKAKEPTNEKADA